MTAGTPDRPGIDDVQWSEGLRIDDERPMAGTPRGG
jgi:hypothetical protein